jgi:ribonuclease-3
VTIAGYRFGDPELLRTALTHSSYANESAGAAYNERLEFLGDAVLGFLTAEFLYAGQPGKQEGELTKIRAGYVCEQSLASAARRLKLGEALRLGRGEDEDGGRERDSLLADAFEAVLAAIYLDGGIEPCRKLLREELLNRAPAVPMRDAKSRLQEVLQGRGMPAPVYRTVSESGPEHHKTFIVEVFVEEVKRGTGTGRTKKQAEQEAAGLALESL